MMFVVRIMIQKTIKVGFKNFLGRIIEFYSKDFLNENINDINFCEQNTACGLLFQIQIEY